MIEANYIGDFTDEEKAEILKLSHKGIVFENEHMRLEFLCTDKDLKDNTITVIATTKHADTL